MFRAPQRRYSSESLEVWFQRLQADWERWFRRDELEFGRRLYRKNAIQATELTPGAAVVSFKDQSEDVYAVIEWRDGCPEVRLSTDRIQPARGLGVAGLYELEELVAEQVSSLPPEPVQPGTDDFSRVIDPAPVPEPPPARPLRLEFSPGSHGLLVKSFWLDPQSPGHRKPAFPGNVENESEREQIIRLTALLHRSGFEARPKAHGHYMPFSQGVLSFLQQNLSAWRKHFEVWLEPSLKPWRAGLQRVEVELRLDNGPNDLLPRWQVRSTGRKPSEATIAEILKHPTQTHFVPGEGVFRVDAEQAEVIAEWKPLLDSFAGSAVPPYLLFRFCDHPGIRVRLSERLDGWRRQWRQPAAVPDDLPDWLRQYQKEGVSWLDRSLNAGVHPLLADEMGLGKTVQALVLIHQRALLRDGPVLVVCPASVIPVWLEETGRFFPEMKCTVVGSGHVFVPDAEPCLWLCSYTQLRRHKARLEGMSFSLAILDEAQFIKNPDGKTSHTCLGIRARHRLALTGTPVENHPLDLWTIFRFLMPGLLDGRAMVEARDREDPQGLLQHFRRQLKPFVLRRTKSGVASDLPPRIEVDLHCVLTPRQEMLYRQMTEDGLRQLRDRGEKVSRMHIFALMTRLRQICCDPALLPGVRGGVGHSAKLRVLQEKLEEALASGSKVVVFSQFVGFLKRVRLMLTRINGGLPLYELTGKTRNRGAVVAQFREEPGAAVFLVSLRAGGTGLNLQVADYVFLMDPWWNPAVEAQAVDRVHRIGQQKRVFVYRLLTKGTLEDRIGKLKERKTEVFQTLMGGMGSGADRGQYLEEIEEWLRFNAE